MPFQHGVKATLTVGATSLTGYTESATMDLQRELAEIRPWGANSVARVHGLRNITFTSNGAYDAVADAALFAAWNGDTPVSVVFSPDGGTTTYTVSCLIASYSITAGSGDKVTYTVNLSSSGDVSRA